MLKVSSELLLKKCGLGFPGGPLVKNPARNAGTLLQTLVWKISHAMGQVSPCIRVTEPKHPGAHAP